MTHDSCGCGHCHHDEDEEVTEEHACACGHDHSAGGHEISHEDMEKLKQAIIDAGYKIEETPDGDIKILEK